MVKILHSRKSLFRLWRINRNFRWLLYLNLTSIFSKNFVLYILRTTKIRTLSTCHNIFFNKLPVFLTLRAPSTWYFRTLLLKSGCKDKCFNLDFPNIFSNFLISYSIVLEIWILIRALIGNPFFQTGSQCNPFPGPASWKTSKNGVFLVFSI